MRTPFYDSNRALALLEAPSDGKSRRIGWAVVLALVTLQSLVHHAQKSSADFSPSGLLESTFTLSALLAAVLAFRSWSRLYPNEVPTVYASFPLNNLSVLYSDLKSLVVDALAMMLTLIAWSLPALLHTSFANLQWVLLYAVLAALCAFLVSFGVSPAVVRSFELNKEITAAVSKTDALHSSAPALSFGVSAALLLFIKLGVGDLYRYASIVDASQSSTFWAQIPLSSRYAIGIPSALALLLFTNGALLRLRFWLRSVIWVAALGDQDRDLSYAWIDAKEGKTSMLSVRRLLVRRDLEQLRRRAPFQLWIVGLSTLVASLVAVFASDLYGLILIALHALYVLAWLRIPRQVSQARSQALRDWDRLLVSDEIIVKAQFWTMAQMLLPYLLLTLLPGALYFGVRASYLWLAVFSLGCAGWLIVHAFLEGRERKHV